MATATLSSTSTPSPPQIQLRLPNCSNIRKDIQLGNRIKSWYLSYLPLILSNSLILIFGIAYVKVDLKKNTYPLRCIHND